LTSVVAAVINFERADLTAGLVAALVAHRATADVQVIAVDNGSNPAELARLRETLHPAAELLVLPTNRGYAAACNAASRAALAADADYVWLLNNDLDIEAGVLDALVSVLETSDWAAAAPVTVDALAGETVLGAGADLSVGRGRLRHRWIGRPRTDLPSSPFEVTAIEGACPLVRLTSLRSIGTWDEGFFMYWEDAEWSVRARRSGYAIGVVPTVAMRHQGGASSDSAFRSGLMLRNRLRFVRVTGSAIENLMFAGYFVGLWLPAFTLARLIPRFGLRPGIALAYGSLAWNLADARRRRRWRLRRVDQEIPALDGPVRREEPRPIAT
jgi:N-acetylglucosaminyl-diphospho-decaprenol L-rhamnosyltransferase